MRQVYGMLLARELPQVNVPESYLPLDLNAARVNIEKAAYHGFAKAQVKMGAAYELGQLSCDFNPALSLHYNALAARQGEPEAEMAISKWFLCGHEGVFEKNDELAFKFAHRAALSGFPTAEFALGYFYEVGIYVDVDLKEARSWYAKAAANGNKDATSRIDSISRSKTLSRKDHENVAIARIKSRYGSHQRESSLESMQENLEMPDPSRMSLSDTGHSAAPYPDRPGSRSRPVYPQGYSMADPRPSSAFGINPNIRANAPNYNRAASYGPGPQGCIAHREHPNSISVTQRHLISLPTLMLGDALSGSMVHPRTGSLRELLSPLTPRLARWDRHGRKPHLLLRRSLSRQERRLPNPPEPPQAQQAKSPQHNLPNPPQGVSPARVQRHSKKWESLLPKRTVIA
jgi:hypothetical protein